MTNLNTYEETAQNFANSIGLKIKIGQPTYGQHFYLTHTKEDSRRWAFPVTLSRGGKSYRLKFGQSLMKGATPPTTYDILSCLTKYDPYTFEDFCTSYGYDTNSRQAEKIYKAVVKEWEGVNRLFADVIEELQNIE